MLRPLQKLRRKVSETHMSKRVGVLATIVAAMIGSLALPSGATAATEFGDNCVADYFELKVPYLLYEGSNASNPLPVSVPSSGVITKWKVNIMPTPGSGLLRLAAVHPASPGSSGSAQIVGETTVRAFGGQNTFDARVPVAAGELDRARIRPGRRADRLQIRRQPGGDRHRAQPPRARAARFPSSKSRRCRSGCLWRPCSSRTPTTTDTATNPGQCPQVARPRARVLRSRSTPSRSRGRARLRSSSPSMKRRPSASADGEARQGENREAQSPDHIAHAGPDRQIQAQVPGVAEGTPEAARLRPLTPAQAHGKRHQLHRHGQQRQPQAEAQGEERVT